MKFINEMVAAAACEHRLTSGWAQFLPPHDACQSLQLARVVGGLGDFGTASMLSAVSGFAPMGIAEAAVRNHLDDALGGIMPALRASTLLDSPFGVRGGFLPPWLDNRRALQGGWSEATRGILPSLMNFASLDAELFRERLRRFAEIARTLGWPPPMRMRSSQITVVLDLFDEGGVEARDEIEALFVDEFDDETLGSMVADWRTRPWVAEHLDTMVEAVDAYRAELYAAAVYTSIPMVEALIIDAMSERRTSHKQLEDFIKRAIGARGADDCDRALAGYIADHHFAKFHRGDPIPATPSRHAVAHGAHPKVGTRANALRVLILLDLVQDALAFVAAPTGRIVHLPSCYRGQRIGFDRRRVFRSLGEARAAGLAVGPCCPSASTAA